MSDVEVEIEDEDQEPQPDDYDGSQDAEENDEAVVPPDVLEAEDNAS